LIEIIVHNRITLACENSPAIHNSKLNIKYAGKIQCIVGIRNTNR